MNVFSEFYEKKGIKPYKPTSAQVGSAGIGFAQDVERWREKRGQRKYIKEETGRMEEYEKQTEENYRESVEANKFWNLAKATIRGIPEAAPITFKKLATPEGVKSLGRGYIKGLTLGWLAPETPQEADEVERAIEAGWEAAGFFTTFLGGEAALNMMFKSPLLLSRLSATTAAKFTKAAPYISRASAWLGTSQLHKDLRGAGFETRAKQAGIDAATLLLFEGLSYGVGKAITKFKIPPALHAKGIKSFQYDMTMKFGETGMNIPLMAKYSKSVNLSNAKTLKQAVKIYQKGIPKGFVKSPSVAQALKEAVGMVKRQIFSIAPAVPATVPPLKRVKGKLKPTQEIRIPTPTKVTPKAELEALKRIEQEFPGTPGIIKRIKKLEKIIKPVVKPISKEFKPVTKIPTIKDMPKLKVGEYYIHDIPQAGKRPKGYGVFKIEKNKIPNMVKFFETRKKAINFYTKGLKIQVPKVISVKAPPMPKVSDLAFVATKFKTPTPKIIKAETAKLIKRSEIAQTLSEKLDVPIRRGHFGTLAKKVLGIYKEKPELMRVRGGGFPTVAHEAGHHISKRLPEFQKMINRPEMEKLLLEYGGKPQGRKAREEAFAEFMRFYVTEPAKAQRRAPEFSKHFKKTVQEKYPEIRDILLEARRDYKRWTEMDAVAQIASVVSTKTKKAGLKERVVGRTDEIYIAAKDDLYPLKQFQNLAKGELGDIPKRELPYVLARLIKGWVGKADVFLEKGTFSKKFWTVENGKIVPVFKGKSFKEILRPVERIGGLEDLAYYLIAKRTIELKKRKITVGITTDIAEKAIKQLNKKYPTFAKVSQEIYKFQDDVLTYGFENGLFDAEVLAKIRAYNKTYVPFYRVFEELQHTGYFGKGFANMSNSLKRIKGSERDIINPLESIVKNTYAIINAAERNNVGVMMANLSIKNKAFGRNFTKIDVPVSKVATIRAKELGVDFTDRMTGEIVEKTIDIFRPSLFIPRDNILTVLMGGKKVYFEVEPMLYKALMATEQEQMALYMKLLSAPTSWLRAGAILSPEFMVRNPLRDLWSAFVYSKYGFYTPIDFAKGIFGLVGKDKDYWMWRMGGGEHSMLVSMDRDYLKKTFDEVIKGKGAVHYMKNPMESLRIFSEMSEVPTRLGEFKKGIAKMKDPVEAAYASREITLDFAKMGEAGRTVNRIIAFWNSWAEGWDKMIREFKHHPTRTTAKVVSGITLPSITLYLINRDDPRWKEIPQWQKDIFWIVMTEDHIYRIPKPFELGILFGSVPERILEYIDNKDPKALETLAENVLVGQSPGIMPTALTPLIENWTNYNLFLKRPIVPESRKDLPPEAQYTAYTSETAKKMGAIANYSPAKIDNLFRGYFAGLGRYAISGIDQIMIGTGISTVIKPEPDLADKPIIRAFVIRRPIGSASESVNRFYDKYYSIESKERMMKEYIQNNEKEKFYAYKNKYPEVLFAFDYERNSFYSISARFYRKVAHQMGELRKKERQIHTSKTLSPEEKREKITKIDELITKLAQKALEFKIKK